jgi:hypothetical protein
MYIEGRNLESYLSSLDGAEEYMFKHIFEKELRGEFYYLVEFYKEVDYSKLEILRFWLKFDKNIGMKNLVARILEKNCNTYNQFVHYKEDNGVKGLLTIDANYLNAVDSSIGTTYTIFEIEKIYENLKFAYLIKYLNFKTRTLDRINFTLRENCFKSWKKIKKQIKTNLTIEANKFRFINNNQVTQFMSLEEGKDGQVKISSKDKEETFYYTSTLDRSAGVVEDGDVILTELNFSYIDSNYQVLGKKILLLLNSNKEQNDKLSNFISLWENGLKKQCKSDGTLFYEIENSGQNNIQDNKVNVKAGELNFSYSFELRRKIFKDNGKEIENISKIELLKDDTRDVLKITQSNETKSYYYINGSDSHCRYRIAEFPFMLSEKCEIGKISVISINGEPELLGKKNHYSLVIRKDKNNAVDIIEIEHSYHKSAFVEKFVVSDLRMKLIKGNFLFADVLVVTYFDKEFGEEREISFNTRAFKHCDIDYKPFTGFDMITDNKKLFFNLNMHNK